MSCQNDGKKGFKWGQSGKCYTYTTGDKSSMERAREKAKRQGRAIQVNKSSLNDIEKCLDNIKESLKSIS